MDEPGLVGEHDRLRGRRAARRTPIEKPTTEPIAGRWIGYLRQALPHGRIDIGTLFADVDLWSFTGDPADEHACALALTGNAPLARRLAVAPTNAAQGPAG